MAEFLRISKLTKHFRGLVANEDVDFTLGGGDVRCIIGPNGAGKTTFISMISGHVVPTSGRIAFKGRDITGMSVPRRARLGIGRKFQTPSVFDNLTVAENVELASIGKHEEGENPRANMGEVLQLTRLEAFASKPALTLSHGQRQWLEIGMLLANRAELLLLDEPTAGMSAEETHATAALIKTLAAEFGIAIVIIEHDINFIRDLGAPVTVLHLGRVLMEGDFAAISENEDVRNVYLGGEWEC